MNRLAREHSPYLLQHAGNPVDWYPWGDEAFERARREDKPVFLSIGYSTCHWCHVMEHESFVSPEIAGLLNHDFVSIKVDREERPDVDRVYMAFVQATTGSGGWPMTVFLTPDLKPFYGGTYFPPTSRWGRPGFADLLRELARVWKDDRSRVNGAAAELFNRLQLVTNSGAGSRAESQVAEPDALDQGVEQFQMAFDRRQGGFGEAPKFPRPSELLFLLREHARRSSGGRGAQAPLLMVTETLRAMALGGMRDHVGGGFHRYSVDAEWRVPHFEKMLYDQGQLVLAYLEAGQASGDRFFSDVAEDTLAYVLRDMTDPAGGFYSAEDADSVPPDQAGDASAHKMEGAFYIWSDAEIAEVLGEDAALARRRFGIEAGGNAPNDPHGEFTGKNLLYVSESVEDIAARTRLRGSGGIDHAAARSPAARGCARAPAPAASRRQGPDRVERVDDCRVRQSGAGPAGQSRPRTVSRRGGEVRGLHPVHAVACRLACAAATVPGRGGRHRRLRRGLRVPDFRTPRIVPGDRECALVRLGAHAADRTGRPLLGCVRGRLVQHDRPRPVGAAAAEGGPGRRRTVGQLDLGAERADAGPPDAGRRRCWLARNARSAASGRESAPPPVPCR